MTQIGLGVRKRLETESGRLRCGRWVFRLDSASWGRHRRKFWRRVCFGADGSTWGIAQSPISMYRSGTLLDCVPFTICRAAQTPLVTEGECTVLGRLISCSPVLTTSHSPCALRASLSNEKPRSIVSTHIYVLSNWFTRLWVGYQAAPLILIYCTS